MDPGPMIHKAERSIGVIQAELNSTGIRNRSFVMAGDPFEILHEKAHSEGGSVCALPHLVYKAPGGAMPPPDPFRRITVATDLSPARTDIIFKELKTLLAGRSVPMTILHSLFMEDTLTSTEMFQVASAALEEVRATVEKWNPGTGAEVLGGHPEVEILRRVDKIKPGMLVVGLSVHGHLWELIVGSTGEAIIERSSCPVLVIPS